MKCAISSSLAHCHAHLFSELGQPELDSDSCISLQQSGMLLNGNLHLQHEVCVVMVGWSNSDL